MVNERVYHHTQGKPRHNQSRNVVHHLYMQEEHSDNVMAALVNPSEMHDRIQTGSERSIQPPSSLTNELGRSFRHIGFTL